MTQNLEKFIAAISKSHWSFGARVPGRGVANKIAANKFAKQMRPILMELSLLAGAKNGPVVLARMLNERGIPTVRGGEWHPETVKRLMRRLQPEFDEDLKRARAENYKRFAHIEMKEGEKK